MKYEIAPDIQKISEEISRFLFPHVKIERMKCFRSYGSSSKGTIARCHTIGKLLQKAMDTDAFYALEFISERFDKLPEEEKIKTIIHELMHIPQTFGGGFRHHDHVCERNVNMCYRTYKEKLEKLRLGLAKVKGEETLPSVAKLEETRRSDVNLKKDLEEKDFLNLKELKWKNQDNIKQMKDIRKNAEKGFFYL